MYHIADLIESEKEPPPPPPKRFSDILKGMQDVFK